MSNQLCPLCGHDHLEPFHQDKKRRYERCQRCALVVVPPDFHLSGDQEKEVYDLHQNDPEDMGYRRFLSRICTPLLEMLPTRSSGLDFGCGPGPTLSVMLEEAGHNVTLFDLHYQNNPRVLTQTYDFICATEVVEHLKQPGKVFDTLFAMLKPGAPLAIMTKLVLDQKAFSTWHYTHDPTHIAFFSRETFAFIAKQYGASFRVIGNDVIVLQV